MHKIQAIYGPKFVEVVWSYEHEGISHSQAGSLLFTHEGYKAFRKLVGSGAISSGTTGVKCQLIETNFPR